MLHSSLDVHWSYSWFSFLQYISTKSLHDSRYKYSNIRNSARKKPIIVSTRTETDIKRSVRKIVTELNKKWVSHSRVSQLNCVKSLLRYALTSVGGTRFLIAFRRLGARSSHPRLLYGVSRHCIAPAMQILQAGAQSAPTPSKGLSCIGENLSSFTATGSATVIRQSRKE